MKIDNELLIQTVKKFKQAPISFYSPLGRKPLLIQEEIIARNIFASSNMKVSNKEMVFRKLWEVSLLPLEDWEFVLERVVLKFLNGNSISNELLIEIINELIKEIEMLKKTNGRTIHNPF